MNKPNLINTALSARCRLLHSAFCLLTSVVAFFILPFVVCSAFGQTTNNPGVPIFGAGGTASGLQFVFVNGLGNIASPANFDLQNANGIVTSAGATNSGGSRVAFMSDVAFSQASSTNQFGQAYTTTTGQVGSQTTNRNSAVPQTIWAQYDSGSASAFYDLPPNRDVIQIIQPNPWIGTITTDSRTSTNGTVYQYQTNLDQLVGMATYFNTSGIAAALSPYSTAPNIWVDQLWYSNHLANGLLVPLPGKFTGGLSNVLYQVHQQGATATFHIYQYPGAPIQTNGDTELDFAQTPTAVFSWPSQNTQLATNSFWFPLMNALNTRSWVDWAYQQGMDGIFSADCFFVPSFRGYDYWRAATLYDAIMYPNLGVRGEGRDRWDLAYPWATHPLWLGFFVNQPHLASLTEVNVWTPDQSAPGVGTGGGLSQAMQRLEWFYNTAPMTNQPANSAMPLFSANDFTAGAGVTFNLNDYTNYYSVLAITHGCAAMAWTRENNTWNTLQNTLTTNAGFLSVWQDKPRFMPLRYYDNGTNSVWFNKHSSGDVLIFAENRGSTPTNLSIDLGQAGFIPTNNVFYDVIPVFGGIYTGGTVSNVIQTNLAANTSLFWRLRKQSAWNDVPLSTISLQSASETFNPSNATPVLALPGAINYFNSSENDCVAAIPFGNGNTNILFQMLYESQSANTFSNNIYTRWSDTAQRTSEVQGPFSNHIAANGILWVSWTNHFTNDNYPRMTLFANMALTNSLQEVLIDKIRWRTVPQ